MKAKLKVKLCRSVIGQSYEMRERVRGLGLSRPGQEVYVDNTPSFRGAIRKVLHLVTVVEV